MSMSLAEGRAECKRLFDECAEILAKYGGKITDETPNDERKRIDDNLAEINGLEIKMGGWKRDAELAEQIQKGADEYGRPSERPPVMTLDARAVSIGRYVTSTPEYRSAVQPGGALTGQRPYLAVALPPDVSLVDLAIRTAMAHKTLLTSNAASTGVLSINDRLPGITEIARAGTDFLNILPTLQTTSDVVEWVQQTGRTNNAAPVAEASASTGTSGTKSESGLAYAVKTAPVETIATHIPATTRSLADAPMLRSAIDDELLYMIRQVLQTQTITGDGNSPNLLGLNNQPGIQTGAAGTDAIAAIFNAAIGVQVNGGVPATDVLLNQTAWAAIRLLRENTASGTLGGYIMGSPNQPGPMTIFGLGAVFVPQLPANTAFVLNATATTLALVEREGGTVTMGWVNDDFLRNIVRILAELRALLIVRRPQGIFKLTGMP
jgi:HK97 family phage major capsid protein